MKFSIMTAKKALFTTLSIGLLLITFFYTKQAFPESYVENCTISAASTFEIQNKNVNVDLINSGSEELAIDRISLVWPERLGNLQSIILYGKFVKGDHSPAELVLDESQLGDANKRAMKAGETQTLKFQFKNNNSGATPEEIVAVVEFGIGCSVVVNPGNLDVLPPDPGPANDLTLEGIDADNDGVRDDIERWILEEYPESERVRAALSQQAKAFAEAVENADTATEEELIAYDDKIVSTIDCIYNQFPETLYGIKEANRADSFLQAEFLNTAERGLAWIKVADATPSGTYHGLPPERYAEHCDFNPEDMEN